MSWPEKTSPSLDASEKRTLGEGVFRKCAGCGATTPSQDLVANYEVCKSCGHHHPLAIDRWYDLLLDDGALSEWDGGLRPVDRLNFDDGKPYVDRLAAATKRSQVSESVQIGRARMAGREIAFGSFVFSFLGGSMGSVAGEKIARLFERATEEDLPVVLAQASGGARMQEGILSLMQMAKSVNALERFRAKKRPYISLLLHPTTGGVAASFAFLGDVNIAEHGALIGFAGPRVIESTLRQTLPRGFQRPQFLIEHGMVDRVVSRLDMKSEMAQLIELLSPA